MDEPKDPPATGAPDDGESPPPRADTGGGTRRVRARTAWGPGGWARRLAKLWGFLGFCILVLVLARAVILPFVFALLLAYILAPIVRRLSTDRRGHKRMPRGAAIILCYVVFLALMALFLFALLPRLSKDVARIGREAPELYQRLNDEWAPAMAGWLEKRFPSIAPDEAEPVDPPVVADVPLPPGTQFVVTPLPDGRLAIQLEPTGIELSPAPGGGYVMAPRHEAPSELRLEDRLRSWAKGALGSLQGQLGDVLSLGQAVVVGIIKSIFSFFLVLMIAAFILLDIEKIHGFARSLIPVGYRGDYDQIAAGVDRGLSGVIRGQLMICLVNGVLTYVGLVLFDIKYSLILAVVAAVLSLIPIFGSILSTVPIVLAALVSGESGIDVARGVFILFWIIGIHFIEANLLNPKIIGTAAKIHPVLVIFALIAGEHSYGLTGALLAVPVASVVQVLFLFFRGKMWRTEGATGPQPTLEA